LGSIHNS